jgi:DNA-binding LacI/PurR family transcriptional regulator
MRSLSDRNRADAGAAHGALIIASTQRTTQPFARIGKQRVPAYRNLEGLDANFTGRDDLAAGMLATEQQVAQGCRRTGQIGSIVRAQWRSDWKIPCYCRKARHADSGRVHLSTDTPG